MEVTSSNNFSRSGQLLAEPFKKSKYAVKATCGPGNRVSLTHFWSTSEGETSSSPEPEFTFHSRGIHALFLHSCPEGTIVAPLQCSPGTASMVHKFDVRVLTIRKNILKISAEERQRYFQAVKMLRVYSTEEGRTIFGENFMSYSEIAAIHGATVWVQKGQCDFGHHGPALLTYHRAYGRLFERAIQAVDPTVASHYWDYLAEGELSQPENSTFFSEDFFGDWQGDPTNNYAVMNGQFASWPIPSGEEALSLSKKTWGGLGPSNMLNPYGFLRSPDNANPSPTLTRYGSASTKVSPSPLDGLEEYASSPGFAEFGSTSSESTLPTFEDLRDCTSLPTFGEFILCLDTSRVHPIGHSMIGGSFNNDEFETLSTSLLCSRFGSLESCQTAFNAGRTIGGISRGLGVIEGCITCAKKCNSLSQGIEECPCKCVEPASAWCSGENVALRYSQKFNYTLPDEMDKGWEFVRMAYCNEKRGMGDHEDAGSASMDPIFWPYHSNVDRMLTTWRKSHLNVSWNETGFTYPSRNSSFFPDFTSVVNLLDPSSMYPGVVGKTSIQGESGGACEGQGLFDEVAMGAFANVFENLAQNVPPTNLDVLNTVDEEIETMGSAEYIYDSYFV